MGKEQFDQAEGREGIARAVRAGLGRKGQERLPSRQDHYRAAAGAGNTLASRRAYGLLATTPRGHEAVARSDGLVLGGDQLAAFKHVVKRGDIALVPGYAGTGECAMLVCRATNRRARRFAVRGAAGLSAIAAENL
jgi:hypothetical protein